MPDRLAPGVWLLDVGWPEPLGANAYLVDDGSPTLVDAGLPVAVPGLRREIETAGYAIADIDRVLVTHYDLDHVGGLSRLVPDLDAPVYLGKADLDLLSGATDPPWLHHKGLFHHGLRVVYQLPRSLSFEPVEDGQTIGGFTAFHTPGHNPGHTIYVNPEMSAAGLGDLVWKKRGMLTTPSWLDSYDMRELRASIRQVTERLPPFEVACVGHGTPLRSGGQEALAALAARLDGGNP